MRPAVPPTLIAEDLVSMSQVASSRKVVKSDGDLDVAMEQGQPSQAAEATSEEKMKKIAELLRE
eukprot:4214366-Alexandrium_andersonii.AAC.1